MNKTININLDGMAFKIEEEAYEKLDSYLETIRKRLGNNDEAEEIIADIEARIAELFRYKCEGCTIPLTAVNEIIDTIGEPAEIVDEEDSADNSSSEKSTGTIPPYTGKKALYRDPDDRVLGGVCAGLGAYFDVDPLVFRIIAVVTTIAFQGVPLLIYIILWIAMPKAKTLAQRIAMRGGLTFKKMGDDIKNEYQTVSEKYKNRYRNKYSTKNSGDYMSNGLNRTINVFGVILGIGIILFSVVSIMAITGFFVFKDAFWGLTLTEGKHFIVDIPGRFIPHIDQTLAYASVLLLVGIPLLVVLYLGLKLIIRFRSNGKLIGTTALMLWLSGFVLISYTAIHVAKSFKTTANVTEEHVLEPTKASTIYFKSSNNTATWSEREFLMDIDHLEMFVEDSELVIEGSPVINIKRGDFFKVSIDKQARGYDTEDASFNASATEYSWSQNDSVIYLDRHFSLGHEALVRQQKVYVNIEIPYDKELEVNQYLERLIDNY